MTVDEGLELFRNIESIPEDLLALSKVGLNYLSMGQSATTLSGGEAQRVKLAAELSKKATGRTCFILDEPTTGLHFADIEMLVRILLELREAGNTVIVIEHHLDVIKCADYIIDLGPEGGHNGGKVVCYGTPEEVAGFKGSYTGGYLAGKLKK
jgi:excinuclease ABC subunit A